ncbi:MAG: hypothetical protein HY720_03785 [Planctomycetes bacterium]|nr:hypothetical protein [Planctomycetota bacterium]
MTREDAYAAGPITRRVDPVLRLGRLALDWELVTARQVLQLRLAAEAVAEAGLDIPSGDLFLHLELLSPAELQLLLAKAGTDEIELARRSPLAEIAERLRGLAKSAFSEGRVFPPALVEEVKATRAKLEEVGVRLEPWQILTYRGELGAERRIELEVAESDRKNTTRREEREELLERRGPERILRAVHSSPTVRRRWVAGAAVLAVVGIFLSGWAIFGGPSKRPGDGDLAGSGNRRTGPNLAGTDDTAGAGLAEALSGDGVQRFPAAPSADRSSYRPPGAGPAAAGEEVPAKAFEAYEERERVLRQALGRPAVEGGSPHPSGTRLAAASGSAASGSSAGRAAIRIAGTLPLPDGAWLDLVLIYEGIPILSRRAAVKAAAFEATFVAPEGKRSPVGLYEAEVRCIAARQPPQVADAVRSAHPDGFLARIEVAVGTPQELREEAARTRERLETLLATAAKAWQSFEEAAANLPPPPESGKADPAELAAWRGFVDAWQESVASELARPLADEHAEYLVPPRPGASAAARELVATLADLARERSCRLYRERDLAPPAQDVRPFIEGDRGEGELARAAERLTGIVSEAVSELQKIQ